MVVMTMETRAATRIHHHDAEMTLATFNSVGTRVQIEMTNTAVAATRILTSWMLLLPPFEASALCSCVVMVISSSSWPLDEPAR